VSTKAREDQTVYLNGNNKLEVKIQDIKILGAGDVFDKSYI